jgi:MarR family transcriptional regulator, transcriptional regulator for hemolysin
MARGTPDFDIDDTLNSRVYRVNLALRGRLQAALGEFDITTEQWSTLCRLYKRDGCNQKQLSRESDREQAALTRTLDILEAKGLVKRASSPEDRREYLVMITENGRSLYTRALPAVLAYGKELRAALPTGEFDELNRLLSKLASSLGDRR